MTTFADLKVGDIYILASEDEPGVKVRCQIVEISEINDEMLGIQFDDGFGTYTWGLKDAPIHEFMEIDHGQDI